MKCNNVGGAWLERMEEKMLFVERKGRVGKAERMLGKGRENAEERVPL